MEIETLDLEQVMRRVKMTDTKIFELIDRGEFPAHYDMDSGRPHWDKDDIDEWLNEYESD